MQDDIFERQKALIEGENVNVSEPNVLKEFLQIVINILLAIIVVYFFVFIVSGLVIKSLPIEKQIILEDFMAKVVSEKDTKELDKKYDEKINGLKDKILKHDKDFPKTSKLNIKILVNKKPNALCLPNGNIYITSSLFDKIKTDDEMLFFVIAHEMAHYKNKDHIMNLRKSISSSVVLFIIALGGNNSSDLHTIVKNTIDLSDLNYSRSVEARADTYAGKMLMREYGSTLSGVKTLQLLSDKHYPERFYILSSHPSINKRIENLKKIEKSYTD